MANKPKLGRPSKNAQGRRNFTFIKPVDDFLADEKARTGWDMTLFSECVMLFFKSFKPAERDEIIRKQLAERAKCAGFSSTLMFCAIVACCFGGWALWMLRSTEAFMMVTGFAGMVVGKVKAKDADWERRFTRGQKVWLLILALVILAAVCVVEYNRYVGSKIPMQ